MLCKQDNDVDSDYSGSDFDNDDEEGKSLPSSRPPTAWTEERRPDHLVTLCKRELPAGDGHRLLMSNHGFPAELVERAIQELGLIGFASFGLVNYVFSSFILKQAEE